MEISVRAYAEKHGKTPARVRQLIAAGKITIRKVAGFTVIEHTHKWPVPGKPGRPAHA